MVEPGFEGRRTAVPCMLLFDIFTGRWERSLKTEGRDKAGFRLPLGNSLMGIQEDGGLQVGQQRNLEMTEGVEK